MRDRWPLDSGAATESMHSGRSRTASSGCEMEAEGSRSSSPTRGRTDSNASWTMTRSRSDSCCDENASTRELDTMAAQADRWAKLGKHMNKKPWQPQWANQGKNNVLNQGEAMLREQSALDDRRELLKVIENEGDDSPMRHHVAGKIRIRLQEEKERDANCLQDLLDTQQRCINIKKNMSYMQAARRDLTEQKRRVQETVYGVLERTNTFSALSAELHFRKSVHHFEENE